MQYKGVWTNKGLEKLAAFASGGKAVSFAQVAIGDGGGAIPEPSAAVTALAGEVWRGAINTVSQNAENTSSVLVEIVIPYNVGGFFIREWGIYDDEGDLLVYGNHAEFYKALLAEGTGAELRELIELPITNEGAVQITVSYESLASVDFVKSQIQEVLQELSDHENDPKAHEEIIADAVKKAAGLPLGHYFLHPHENIPEYAIAVNGGTYSRTLYKDLWAYAQKNGWVKTEAEWQELAGQNNGCCPYWSDGDGETTFRVPKFAPYQKLALTAGTYFEAGLPNITGGGLQFGSVRNSIHMYGALFNNTLHNQRGVGVDDACGVDFDASRSSAVYGNSDTVQPESHTWILCIVALNEATNIGEADVTDVMAAIGAVQNDMTLLSQKMGKVQLLDTRTQKGTVTLTDLIVGQPVFILYSGDNVSNNNPRGAYVRIISGSDNGQYGGYFNGKWLGYYMGRQTGGGGASNSVIFIPNSSVVEIEIEEFTGGTLYFYQ